MKPGLQITFICQAKGVDCRLTTFVRAKTLTGCFSGMLEQLGIWHGYSIETIVVIVF